MSLVALLEIHANKLRLSTSRNNTLLSRNEFLAGPPDKTNYIMGTLLPNQGDELSQTTKLLQLLGLELVQSSSGSVYAINIATVAHDDAKSKTRLVVALKDRHFLPAIVREASLRMNICMHLQNEGEQYSMIARFESAIDALRKNFSFTKDVILFGVTVWDNTTRVQTDSVDIAKQLVENMSEKEHFRGPMLIQTTDKATRQTNYDAIESARLVGMSTSNLTYAHGWHILEHHGICMDAALDGLHSTVAIPCSRSRLPLSADRLSVLANYMKAYVVDHKYSEFPKEEEKGLIEYKSKLYECDKSKVDPIAIATRIVNMALAWKHLHIDATYVQISLYPPNQNSPLEFQFSSDEAWTEKLVTSLQSGTVTRLVTSYLEPFELLLLDANGSRK